MAEWSDALTKPGREGGLSGTQINFKDAMQAHIDEAEKEMPTLPNMDPNYVFDTDGSYRLAARELHSVCKRRSAPA